MNELKEVQQGTYILLITKINKYLASKEQRVALIRLVDELVESFMEENKE